MAPEHSFINAKDFASPKELAEYLNHLNANDEEYLSYLWWHPHYQWENVISNLVKPFPIFLIFLQTGFFPSTDHVLDVNLQPL